MSVIVDHLMLEVTRKCNMKCEHCLRGASQRKSMSSQVIHQVMKQFSQIGDVTFGGGEPTLNLDALHSFFQELMWSDTTLGYFYVVTNGKVYRKALIEICDKLYNVSQEPDMCGLSVSDDIFHRVHRNESRWRNNYRRYTSEEIPYAEPLGHVVEGYDPKSIINQGRAKQNNIGGRELNESEVTIENFKDEGDYYINCEAGLYITYDGFVVNGCNWSYGEMKKHIIGNIWNFDECISKLKRGNKND